MPADRIKKTKVFERNFDCQIMDKKNAIRSESVLIQNTVKVYTDGSKLDGRVGSGFYAEYPNNSTKQAFFHLGIYSTVFQAEVFAIPEVAKNLLLEKMHNQSIVELIDCRAAIKALIKCTVTSNTVFNCIRNLNQLGKQNHVSISWIHRWAQLAQIDPLTAIPLIEKISFANANPMITKFSLAEANANSLINHKTTIWTEKTKVNFVTCTYHFNIAFFS